MKPQKPFDVTLKELYRQQATDYAPVAGAVGLGPVRKLNVDLSAVSVESDAVFTVGEPATHVFDLNFQATWDDLTPARILAYNALLHRQTTLPVVSVVMLLRPEANDLRLHRGIRHGRGNAELTFRPDVVKVWELPPEQLLQGGLGLLPLAPLAASGGKPDVPVLERTLRRVEERLRAEVPGERADQLWLAAYLLSGLLYDPTAAAPVFSRIKGMRESLTYQHILTEGEAIGLTKGKAIGLTEGKAIGLTEGEAKGRAAEARELLLKLGRRKFGPADAATLAAVNAITAAERLESLVEAVLDAHTWDEIFRTP